MADKVDETIEFLRKYEPPEGYLVGFSGGKDSVVLYDLVKRSGVKAFPFYNQVGIEPPELLRFVRDKYPEVKIVRPKEGFFKLLRRDKYYPTIWRRWCCDKLKKEPLKDVPLRHRLMGIRAEESARRKNMGRIVKMRKHRFTMYSPIFDWLEWEIWEYIEANNLPYLSLYDEGFGRVSCVVCPFIPWKQVPLYRERWPQIYRAFEKAMFLIWEFNREKREGKEWESETFEEFMEGWYRSDWSYRARQKKRLKRLKEIEALGPPKEIKTLTDVEMEHILDTLNYGAMYEWNRVRVAKELGIGFKTLYRKIEEYGLIRTISGEMEVWTDI